MRLLAAKTWRHPTSGRDIAFGMSTVERWYYAARRASDPVAVLKDRLRGDIGRFPSMTPEVIDTLTLQYREHPGWTVQLHFDNLRAAKKECDTAIASYPTIRRTMKAQGMFRQAQPKRATAWNGLKCAASRSTMCARCGTSTFTMVRARCSRAVATG